MFSPLSNLGYDHKGRDTEGSWPLKRALRCSEGKPRRASTRLFVARMKLGSVMIEHTPVIIAVAAIAAFVVGLSKGGLPSVGTLSVPLLATVMSPVTAAALLLPIFVASDMVGLYLYWHSCLRRNLLILAPASLVGVAVGWAFSAYLSSLFIGMLVGFVGVLFCLNAWFGRRCRKSRGEADAKVAP
jgi:uncharacterized membrane protein YfcA